MCVCHAPSRPASVASLLSLTLSSFLLSLLLSGSIEEVLVAQPCSRVWCSCPQSSQNSLSTISSLYPVSRGPTETFTLCQIFVTFVVVAWLTTICSFCLYLLLPDLVFFSPLLALSWCVPWLDSSQKQGSLCSLAKEGFPINPSWSHSDSPRNLTRLLTLHQPCHPKPLPASPACKSQGHHK